MEAVVTTKSSRITIHSTSRAHDAPGPTGTRARSRRTRLVHRSEPRRKTPICLSGDRSRSRFGGPLGESYLALAKRGADKLLERQDRVERKPSLSLERRLQTSGWDNQSSTRKTVGNQESRNVRKLRKEKGAALDAASFQPKCCPEIRCFRDSAIHPLRDLVRIVLADSSTTATRGLLSVWNSDC